MTSATDDSGDRVLTTADFLHMAAGLHAGKDWSLWTEAEKALYLARHELVRQECVAEYSTNPSYQARAAKNPDYWKTFHVGRFNLHPKLEDCLKRCYDEQLKAAGTATTEALLVAFQRSWTAIK